MVHLPIDRDVVAEVIVVHSAMAHVHLDLFQVRVVDDVVSVHVARPQGHGGGSIDRAGGTVHIGHGHGNIRAVTANVSKFHRDS